MNLTIDVAETYIAGWGPTAWIIWSALLALSIAGPFLLVYVTGYSRDTYGDREELTTISVVILIVGLLASAVGMIGLPGHLMRHFVHHEHALFLALGTGVISIVLAIIGWNRARRPIGALLGAPLALGTVAGILDDSLNRGAASVPTSAGAFLLFIVALLVGGLLYARSR